MEHETIADIYSANQKIRESLNATLSSVSADEANCLPEGEKWTIQQIAEHIAIVDNGTSRICGKLVEAAKTAGKLSSGPVLVSPEFGEKSEVIARMKVEAPDRVQPTGDITIDDAGERLNCSSQVFDSMRADLEQFDLSEAKFPHPFFGDLTAVEWLRVAGGHELRHTKQIERLLETIRQ